MTGALDPARPCRTFRGAVGADDAAPHGESAIVPWTDGEG